MNEHCLENIPYASSIAFILLLFGCGVFSGTVWEGTDRIEKLFYDRFFRLREAEFLRVFSISYALVTLIIGAIILVYGSLTTGSTRLKIFQSFRCHNLGKCSAGMLIGACYVLLVGWLLVTCGGMVTVTLWAMVSSVCAHESEYWSSVNLNKDSAKFTYSFNLSNYGVYRHQGISSINSAGAFQEFCSEMSSIGPLFTVGFLCSVVVIMGLLTYISALASNLVRLKYHPELTKFRQAATHSSFADMSEPIQGISNSLSTHPSYPPAPQGPGGSDSRQSQSVANMMYASHSMELQPLTAGYQQHAAPPQHQHHVYGMAAAAAATGAADHSGGAGGARYQHLPQQQQHQHQKYEHRPQNNSLV